MKSLYSEGDLFEQYCWMKDLMSSALRYLCQPSIECLKRTAIPSGSTPGSTLASAGLRYAKKSIRR